jgi:hypothetical protein
MTYALDTNILTWNISLYKELAEKWGLTRMVIYHRVNGRLTGADKASGGARLVPKDTMRLDGRKGAKV